MIGISKRKARLAKEKELAEAQETIAEIREKHQRALAESENLRKRFEKAIAQAEPRGMARLALSLLPVLDALARAIQSAAASKNAEILPFIEGAKTTERQFLAALALHGIKRMDSKGALFDPHRHEALFETPSSDAPPGTILEIVEEGFFWESSSEGETEIHLLRPARVGVAKAESQTSSQEAASSREEKP